MKKIIVLLVVVFFTGCSNDNIKQDPKFQLPPETQVGANTFGCLIDSKLLVQRNGNNNIVNPLSGASLWGGYPNVFDYFELEIIDYKSERKASFLLHMQEVIINGIGNYIIDESNGMNSVDGLGHNYLHCIIFNENTNSYQKYVSFQNSGTLSIDRLTIDTEKGNILSGLFNCKLRNIHNSNDEIEITKGRFDINSRTISQTYFP